MNQCIKCGREIPDGELFCVECSLNPGSSLFPDSRPQEKHPARGRMQTPQPVRRPAPQPVVTAAPKKSGGQGGLKAALAIVSLLLAATLAFFGWQYGSLKQQQTRLKTKEADMLLREKDAEELQEQLDALNIQLADLNQVISQKDAQIKELTTQLSGSQSSQNQSEYDLTAAQAELERLEAENEQLLLLEQDLKDEIQDLTRQVQELNTALEQADSYKVKATFMDTYVVFVEDNGTGYYHTYDCSQFTKRNFWAFSRKRAESNGYIPCPTCGGKP